MAAPRACWPTRQLPGIHSELTLVGGKIVYDSGLLTGKSRSGH
ncbi:hypothetical protein ATSB10_04000 [Dyella thiooxydans]|uniref:Uncharacterized protein n=1 Tax=Dyella thiooxydans TaxID=445710 RepID=A0A160MXV7_9GAMM|nr:hypothetical protein ATSB10_04000 [Dyella thiooxydans]